MSSEEKANEFNKLDELCINTIRVLAADMVEKANSGHPGAPMGLAPVAHILWGRFLNANAKNPHFINRDRFVLSNGHACALQYLMLHLTGYPMTMKDLQSFRQIKSITPGHPECHLTPGIEVSSGPLGQGLAQAVGMAIAEKHLASIFNKPKYKLFNHKIYVMCGDGCMMEGVTSEASSLAGHLKLDNLIVMYDDNKITIDGKTNLAFTEKVAQRYRAYGWQTFVVENGNTDYNMINQALTEAQSCKVPVLILISTKIGYGSKKEDTHGVHGSPLGLDVLKDFKTKMGFNPELNFVVDNSVYEFYNKAFTKRGEDCEKQWNELFQSYCQEFEKEGKTLKRLLSNELPDNWIECLPKFDKNSKAEATRAINGKVLNALAPVIPEIFGGCADLTPSTNTQLACSHDFQNDTNDGRYIRFGVREFAMFAIGNGISSYGCNLIPFTSTFLNFITYGWGAVRLGALSHLRQIYIMTHDSVFLGEDGPTHQPIEVLPLLRATPNIYTFRPCDGNEINAAWIHALSHKSSPTVFCLSRQTVKTIDHTSQEKGLKGAYIVASEETNETNDENKSNDKKLDVILISTGSEVPMCVDALSIIKQNGYSARVVSAPCLELFDHQSLDYRKTILKPNILTISIEAASSFGWPKYSHSHISIDGYGASAPYKQVCEFFGFTPEKIAQNVIDFIAIWKEFSVPLLPCLYK